jgi:hypothetical protein
MRNCSLDQSAERIIAQLGTLLDDERIRREIDEPIDRVMQSFSYDSNDPLSNEFFRRTIGRLVREMYLHGLRLKRNLSQMESVAEAIYILKDYTGQGTMGYDIAVYDALQEGRDGFGHVLEQVGELVKKAERQKYMHWVLGASWDSSDWLTKCQITEFLTKALAPFMPKAILDKPIAQLADDWQNLLFLYLDSQSLLGHLANGKPVFSNH